MNDDVTLSLELPRTAFEPGDECIGKASWACPAPPRVAELRLFMKVESEGPDDVTLVQMHTLDQPQAREARGFRLTLPNGPYSVNGQILAIRWFLELVIPPHPNAARADLVIAPGGHPVELAALPTQKGV